MRRRTIVASVSDIAFQKLMRMKEDDGFEDKDWADWLTYKAKDVSINDDGTRKVSRDTRQGLLSLWMQSFAENLPEIRKGKSITALVPEKPDEVPKGVAIVVGAGPSVYKNNHLSLLSEAIENGKYDGIVCATDKMLIPCLEKNIIPFLTVTVDGSPIIKKWYEHDLVRQYGSKLKVCLNNSVHPEVTQACKESNIDVYWFNPIMDDDTNNESFTRQQRMMTTNENHPKGVPAVSCLHKDTIIYTNHGPKVISALSPKDYVFSFDEPQILYKYFQTIQKNRRIYKIPHTGKNSLKEFIEHCELHKITRVVPTGVKPIYEVVTKTRQVKATSDHQFLVYKNGDLTWLELEKIKVHDAIAVLKALPEGHMAVDPNLVLFLGCYLGDGWSRVRGFGGGEVNLALYDEQLIAKYKDIIRKLYGIEPKINDGVISIYSGIIAKHILASGFGGKALTKTIPPWCFELNYTSTLKFLEGYIDADGSSHVGLDRWKKQSLVHEVYFESPNKVILDGIRQLCIKVGWRVGQLHSRIRHNRKIWNGYRYYHYPTVLTFCLKVYPESKKHYRSVWGRHIAWLHRTKYVGLEEIKSIRNCGKEETYDITVEDAHNFVADACIVHNCGGNAGSATWILTHSLLRRSPIALIGIDMGYPEGTKLEDTPYFSTYMNATSKNPAAIPHCYREVYHPIFKTKAYIDLVFQNYRETWRELAQHTPRWVKTINATEGGALWGKGIKCMTLKDFIVKYGVKK